MVGQIAPAVNERCERASHDRAGAQRGGASRLAPPRAWPDTSGMKERRESRWLRQLTAAGWATAWIGLLWLAHRPWEDLGGLVSERERWIERFALAGGLLIGSALGRIARSTMPDAGERARAVLYPAAVTTVVAMVAFQCAGEADAIGIVLVAFVAYAAGGSTACTGIAACGTEAWRRDRMPDGH